LFKSSSYDIIILGAGCAGLSLLMRLLKHTQFREKSFLLIDKEIKNRNDRTWCFWEKEKGFFEDIVFRKWDTVSFLSDDYSSSERILPYRYKMIRGIDFYRHCFDTIADHPNVELACGEVNEWKFESDTIFFRINGNVIRLQNTGTHVFNSFYSPNSHDEHTIRLIQHFKGWVIKTPAPLFNPGEAVIMDFRVHQKRGTTFVYMLPFDETTALIEYTLFSGELLPEGEYDQELKDYIISFLGINEYTIIEEEQGQIPMTNEKLCFAGHGWQIGTAGGQTKPSSGYTFQFIQKQSQQVTDYLLAGKPLEKIPATPKRFRFYDNTLLHVLYKNYLPGQKIFTELFRKNKIQSVLRFLDNESSFSEDIKIISSLPKIPFLKAAFHQF